MSDVTRDEADGRMVVETRSGTAWLPALLFGLVGALFLVLAFQELQRGSRGLPIAIAIALAVICLLIGAKGVTHAERVTVSIDSHLRRIRLEGWLPWRRRCLEWPFEAISGVELERSDDVDGDAIWRPILLLGSGERVPMMANATHDHRHASEVCERARHLLFK